MNLYLYKQVLAICCIFEKLAAHVQLAVFVTTAIALMERFSWARVAQVYDGNGVLF